MKLIIAYVHPFMAGHVVHALHLLPGVTGASFSDSRGFGRVRDDDTTQPEALHGTTAKVRVEVVVRDAMEDVVVAAIRKSARTGHRGDGKVFVCDVHRAFRIATDEEGDDVV